MADTNPNPINIDQQADIIQGNYYVEYSDNAEYKYDAAAWKSDWKSLGKSTVNSLKNTFYGGTGIKGMVNSFNSIFNKDKYNKDLEASGAPIYLLKPAAISSLSTIITNTIGKTRKGTEVTIDPNRAFYADNNGSNQNENDGKYTGVQYKQKTDKDGNSVDNLDKPLLNTPETYNKLDEKAVNNSIYSKHINTPKVLVPTEDANVLKFKFPDWGYQDFINERGIFQKSIYSGTGEKGWFYFKVFFNFDTQYGLLGGLLNDKNYLEATNSAAKFLYQGRKLYMNERLEDRIVALHKFANILSYISSNAPWFFKSIKNLNTANAIKFTELTKEQSIEIEFNPDAIDMRINTMFDLYQFACFDSISQKEIVPENLRKFDMTVVVFETPLRYLHTAMYSKTYGKFKYKTLDPSAGFDKVMSFKMFHFLNCEFDLASLGALMPSDLNNEQPFEIGKASVKIKYDRVFTHTMNEFMELMFGSDGLYYNTMHVDNLENDGIVGDAMNSQNARYNALKAALDNKTAPVTPSTPGQYKELMDASEAICHYNLVKLGGHSLGNLKGQGTTTGLNHFNSIGQFMEYPTASEYFHFKFSKYAGKPLVDVPVNKVGDKDLLQELVTYSNNIAYEFFGKHNVFDKYVYHSVGSSGTSSMKIPKQNMKNNMQPENILNTLTNRLNTVEKEGISSRRFTNTPKTSLYNDL